MEVTDNLHKSLQIIGFQLSDVEDDSIVFVSELKTPQRELTPIHIIELEKADSFEADAVFFRYFEDNRPPLAQIYIYDNSNDRLKTDYTQIHKELWSSCIIPTFIVIENTKIKFFDSRKPVLQDSNGRFYTEETAIIDLDDITQYAKVIEKYNAEKFKNGSFWESEVAHHNYLYGKTAYINLIDKLKGLRKEYDKTSKISAQLFDYVIIITTLIKFLEENGVDSNGVNLASKFFQESVNCKSFIEILKQNKLVDILDKLSLKFNGGIFNLPDNDKSALREADLSQIINFFDPKIDSKNQFVLWDLYSFKHIPVELISNIYEEFLPAEDKGAVYTPDYLVNFLVDECLPVPTLNSTISFNTKTIDVSCGSGIFLVKCFKRLVEIYKIDKYYKNNFLQEKIEINTLQGILKDNIFGIDVNKNAVELTKFSLQLALCEMLSPKQIWTELAFDDLGENNITQKDFFEFVTNENVSEQFDLVIGNPPFNPPLKSDGSKYEKSEYFNEVVEKYKINPYSIEDSNVALLFLQLSTKLLKQNTGLLCLIQPALPLLHKKNNKVFRQELFSNHNVLQVIDFTTLRRVLFPTATIPTCAIFIENSNNKNDEITHVVIKRTNPSKERLYFEIDTYDIHSIKRENAYLNYSWKSNLFGGYRLYNLIDRIKSPDNKYEKVEDLISTTDQKHITNYSLLKIVEKRSFPSFLKSSNLKNYFDEYYSFLVAYISGTSTRQGLDRPYEVYKSDFLNLPVINDDTLTVADSILVNDIAKYKILEFGNGEKAETNKEIQVKSVNIPESLAGYSKVYLDALNSIYHSDGKKFSLRVVHSTPACFVMQFEYSNSDYKAKIITKDKLDLSPLLGERKKTVDIKKISLIYSQNQVLIIKPKQLRYWLKSVALLDVETTIADVINFNLLDK